MLGSTAMRQFFHNAHVIFQGFLDDTRYFEFSQAVLLLVWTIVLIVPPPTFDVISYHTMKALGTEDMWAVVSGIGAFSGIWGLFRPWPLRSRCTGLLVGVFFWITVGVCVILSTPVSVGGYVYSTLALLCAIAYIFGRRR